MRRTKRRRRPPGLPDLAAKVAFLRRPAAYPLPAGAVQAIETHMSWVFLSGQYAYKLKKPVRRNGIDQRSVAGRDAACRREVRLNRRLAPRAYLEVVPLRLQADGRLTLGRRGRRVDSLVRMRRLPEEATFEHRLQAGTATSNDARRIVAQLAPFFAAAPRVRMTPAAYRNKLARAAAAAAARLRRPAYAMDRALVDAAAMSLRRFMALHGDLLDARATSGRIVEGHGDLRPEHVYLTTPPQVIDCIEFDRTLRIQDPVYELAFLAMECDRRSRPDLGAALLAAWRRRTGDDASPELIGFYKAHNAFKRARIAIWHLDEPDTGPRAQWQATARDYLRHADPAA